MFATDHSGLNYHTMHNLFNQSLGNHRQCCSPTGTTAAAHNRIDKIINFVPHHRHGASLKLLFCEEDSDEETLFEKRLSPAVVFPVWV